MYTCSLAYRTALSSGVDCGKRVRGLRNGRIHAGKVKGFLVFLPAGEPCKKEENVVFWGTVMEGKKPNLIRKKEEKGERGPPFLFFQFAFLKFDGFFSLSFLSSFLLIALFLDKSAFSWKLKNWRIGRARKSKLHGN